MLPFENQSGDEELAYLSDGLAEGLINSFAQLSDLRVISRRSSFRFRDASVSLVDIGRDLDVVAIVTGRLAAHDGALIVSSELVDVRTDRQIWGERYERPAGDVMGLHNDLVTSIAEHLGGESSNIDVESLTTGDDIDPEAYRLYLKGRDLQIGSRREMEAATDSFERAIDRQPDYALAHAGLAATLLVQGLYGSSDQEETLDRARRAVDRALALDDQLAEAHSINASLMFHVQWDWQGAEKEFLIALELSPGSSIAHFDYAEYLCSITRLDESIEQAKIAQRLDPLSPAAPHWIAIALLAKGEAEAAATEFAGTLKINPNWTWGYIKLAKALAHAGRFDEALERAAEAEARLQGDATPAARIWLLDTYVRAGDIEKARASFEKVWELERDKGLDGIYAAEAWLSYGDINKSLDALERAYAEHSPNFGFLQVLPGLFLPELAKEPRFQALIDKSGLPRP